MRKTILSSILLMLGIAFSNLSLAADDFDSVREKLSAAMSSELRSESETDRDKNRKPIETLAFFGLRGDMKVVELVPGGGWYTKLLAPVLADEGELLVAYGASRVATALEGKPGFENLKVIAEKTELGKNTDNPFYFAKNTDLGIKRADMILTFRNYHNFDEVSRNAINASAFKALKSGGIYGVVDHTRRHMQGLDSENGRRFDPVLAIKEIQAAGFEFVDYSDLHYRADDELRYEVGRKTVKGNTDRWTLKFRKP